PVGEKPHAGPRHRQTPHQPQETAGSGGTVHPMDTSRAEPESQPVDENRRAKAPGALELLWTDRKLREPGALPRRNLPHPVQMVAPAEPKAELHLAELQRAAATVCRAAAEDSRRDQKNSWIVEHERKDRPADEGSASIGRALRAVSCVSEWN